MATAGSEMIENPVAAAEPAPSKSPGKFLQVPDMFGHQLSDGHRLRKLGPKELVAVRRAFNDIDQDGSGQIDIVEVRTAPRHRLLRS